MGRKKKELMTEQEIEEAKIARSKASVTRSKSASRYRDRRYELSHIISIDIDLQLAKDIDEWVEIYQQVKGEASTPTLVAKRLVLHTVKEMDMKIAQALP